MASVVANNTIIKHSVKMDVPDYKAMKDSVDTKHGVYFMLASILFFQMVNQWLKSKGPPKTLQSKFSDWKWRNLTVSWLHALIASLWMFLCVFLYPELFEDLLQHINYFTYFCVSFVTGYFLYDTIDIVVSGQTLANWEVMLHHIFVTSIFFLNVVWKIHIAFNIIALSVEVNSFFIHHRKLLQMVATPFDSRKYIIIKHLNLITYVFFRIGPVLSVTLGIFAYHDRVPLGYLLGISISTGFINILNCVLLYRLTKSDLLRSPEGKKVKLMDGLRTDLAIILGQESCSGSSKGHENGHCHMNNNVTETLKSNKTD